MDETEVIFKRKAFGGFNRKDVIAYIADLKKKISDLETKQYSNEMLKVKINELEKKAAKKDEEITNLKAQLNSGSDTQPNDGAVTGELMRESMSYADKYIKSAVIISKEISENTLKKAEQSKVIVNELIEKLKMFQLLQTN